MTGVPMFLFCMLAGAQPPADIPADVASVRELLFARHAIDLPTHDVVVKNGGVAPLTWLATNDELLSVRERALLSLRSFTEPRAHDVCRSLVVDAEVHPKLRAAAIRCLHPADLDAPTTKRVAEGLHDPDPRVVVASQALLREAGRPDLLDAAATPGR